MSGGLNLSHKLDYSAVAFASERQSLLLASLAAPQITGRSNRPPIDLVAVLDRFSSLTTLALQPRVVNLSVCVASEYEQPKVFFEASAPGNLLSFRSGSMSGAKLTSVKDTTSLLVQQMSAEDRLSIVTFESKVRTATVL